MAMKMRLKLIIIGFLCKYVTFNDMAIKVIAIMTFFFVYSEAAKERYDLIK